MSAEQAALQRVLAGEHAAVYAYGVLAGRLAPTTSLQRYAARGYVVHRSRRDHLVGVIGSRGWSPAAAEPGYRLPVPVDTPRQAQRVGRLVEERCAALYAALVATTAGRLRAYAVDAVVDTATRQLGWGGHPVALPGLVDSAR